ncbi:AGAP007719-PA-like protein [Anopheles sinensis]|uniref:AGAP007719-PA-like protein n=1 Tax=Anopheles sinensis TaxID=74873 RepID=A0A084VF45_ANOSI|nr:AGAP007719-PA-like protein [Anopheles sinensis]
MLAVALVHLATGENTVSSGKLLSGPPPPPPPSSSTSLGSLYRSARDDYNARRSCANCGPGYERDMRTYGRRGIVGYYSGMGPIEDDRNWYYRPEVFDDRMRGGGAGYQQPYAGGGYRQPAYMMGYEYDRYMQRPDDRGYPAYGYPGMDMNGGGGYYDPGSSRMGHYPEMMRGYGYRGNGYDNLDPQYEYYMTQRGAGGMSSRDRYYQPQGYYEDRMSYRGQFDHKNFRPWDQTYRYYRHYNYPNYYNYYYY